MLGYKTILYVWCTKPIMILGNCGVRVHWFSLRSILTHCSSYEQPKLRYGSNLGGFTNYMLGFIKSQVYPHNVYFILNKNGLHRCYREWSTLNIRFQFPKFNVVTKCLILFTQNYFRIQYSSITRWRGKWRINHINITKYIPSFRYKTPFCRN